MVKGTRDNELMNTFFSLQSMFNEFVYGQMSDCVGLYLCTVLNFGQAGLTSIKRTGYTSVRRGVGSTR